VLAAIFCNRLPYRLIQQTDFNHSEKFKADRRDIISGRIDGLSNPDITLCNRQGMKFGCRVILQDWPFEAQASFVRLRGFERFSATNLSKIALRSIALVIAGLYWVAFADVETRI
jgi:hypothetical protein